MTLFLSFVFLFPFMVVLVHGTNDAEKQMHEFWSRFGAEYESSVRVFAEDVLKPLADAEVPANAHDATPILQLLRSGTGTFATHLSKLKLSSDAMKNMLDRNVSQHLVTIFNLEERENKTDVSIAEKSAELATKQQKLAEAQANLNSITQSLEKAKQDLKQAEDQLVDAKECIWRGKRAVRRKRFIKLISNGLAKLEAAARDGINDLFCSRNRIDERKRTVRENQERLATQQRTVDSCHQVVGSITGEISALTAYKAKLEAWKIETRKELASLRSQILQMKEVTSKVKNALVHVDSLLTSGETLQMVIFEMIDSESVIEPLERIFEIYKADGMSQERKSVLAAHIDTIEVSALVLRTKLPLYPLLGLKFRYG